MKDVSTKPHASGDTDRIAGLSPVKQALLELRLKKSRARALARQTIARRSDRESDPPLSFAQQRLWFLDQLEPNSALYNIPTALRLTGRLNMEALQKSLAVIVDRHEALRTTFASVDGALVQVIKPNPAVGLATIDLSAWAKGDRELELQRILKQEAGRPFNLASDLMLRSTLVRLNEEENVLLLVMHHIASDGWSIGVLFRELGALYEAFCNAKPLPLPELSIQYADYAIWQQQWLQGEGLDRQLSYWMKQLNGISTLQLPTDRPRPAMQSHRGARHSLVLSKELTESLKALSRKEGATLFMTLLAAFQTLLHRLTGQDDIAVGSPIAGRNWSEIEGLIGFFINSLVLRTDLSDECTFRELLSRVRTTCLEAYAHQDVPFEKLVEELQPDRSLSHSPLFQVMFVLQNAPSTALNFEGLSASSVRIGVETAKFDLTLSMSETVDGLRGSLEYSTDLFDDATIARMIGHLQTLLEGINTNPDQRISQLPILTQAEQDQLLIEWNDTQRDYPKEKCIHELFEAQVEKCPDAVAVVFEDEKLTYRELNTRANRLAHYLQKHGVGPDVMVGICLERSVEMAVGILGVLKAGGAYVPLDPNYPRERLTFMLDDTQAGILITQEQLIEKLSTYSATVICLDRDWEEVARESQGNPQVLGTPDNLVYVIYTSGSTGTPKGTLISHHNVLRLFHATHSKFHFDDNDVWTLFHSYAFDFSVWELWGALLHGGRLVIVSFELSRSPQEFYELLRRERVTVLNQTPSAFRQLMAVEESAIDYNGLELRLVIFGGEALDFQGLKPWFERHGDQKPQLINMYGITETTVHVTYRAIKATDVLSSASSFIGFALPDLELYVLDQYKNLVPIGIPGELYVGGAGLARGYLNRAELTAERFVSHPFDHGQGGRLYRSGDLVRRLSNGELEYLGRKDNQVKIRGFRIELEEVETVLSQHPAVRQSVVIVREDVPGDKRLVAYVVLGQERAVGIDELRSFVKQKFPDYMVPSSFVFVATLPLTSNGKLDLKALLATRPAQPNTEGVFTAARDEIELQLTQIWQKVLRRRPIGLSDNFFDLGGHSLLAVRLISQVEKLTGQRLSLASLFQAPTIGDQARLVRREGWSAPWSSLVAIQPGGSKPPLYCVHAHDGNVLFWRELSRRLGPEQPFYGLQAHGLDGKQAPDTRIEDMASRYVTEIRLLQPEGPYFLGGHCLGGLIAFEMAQQLYAQGQKVGLLALVDSFAPLSEQTVRRRVPLRHRVKRSLALTRLHVENLMLLGWAEKLSYVEVKFNRLLYKIYMSVGTSWILAAQARRRVLAAGAQALRSYRPKVYPGSITLFRATEVLPGQRDEPQFFWGKLAGEGVDVQLVPGYFSQTVYEPRVRVLAERLTDCFDRAQADNSETKRPCDPAISQSALPV